jgi:predicted HTH transcriptional regulator
MLSIHTEQDLVFLRESEAVEFKKATGKDGAGEVPVSFWETYSAMANSDGGYVFFGVAEKEGEYSFIGFTSTDHLRKKIVDLANNPNKVSVNLLTNQSFQDIEIDGKLILCVQIPRAKREQRPVYLNGNPLGNTYRRLHEADQRLSDEEVKRYLAEQLNESRDAEILVGYTIKDIHRETLRHYRQLYANLQPEAPWNELKDETFIEKIGAARRERSSGNYGLTAAGLLMFGTHPVIQERFPYYMLDYQERPEMQTNLRWIDRLTMDGSWSGNLYDFYRRVYIKLIEGLKTPFKLENDKRVTETPVHVALREAFVNALVHADYSDRASILVVKRPGMFRFRNPGLMRIPFQIALKGGEHDCRNRLLHQMFRYVGLGEQAGSGIPKIMKGWQRSHWRPPYLYEKMEPFNQTIIELRTIDLFPQGTIENLRNIFNGENLTQKYDQFDHPSQVALALAFSEGTVTHERLKQLTDEHSADLSKTLHNLVTDDHLLKKTGDGRGTIYYLAGMAAPLDPDDVFGPDTNTTHLEENTTHLEKKHYPFEKNTTHLEKKHYPFEENTTHLEKNTTHLPESKNGEFIENGRKPISRNEDGCIVHKRLKFPVIDKIDKLTTLYRQQLEEIAFPVRGSGKIVSSELEKIIQALCYKRYITISALAALLGRKEKTLRNSYLSRMVREKKLALAFPKTPRDKRQAYTSFQ